MKNQMELSFLSIAENEAFARMVISAFLVQANPTLSIVSEVRTAISEAVTNAIVHAYNGRADGRIVLRATLSERQLELEVEDFGCGIADVDLRKISVSVVPLLVASLIVLLLVTYVPSLSLFLLGG